MPGIIQYHDPKCSVAMEARIYLVQVSVDLTTPSQEAQRAYKIQIPQLTKSVTLPTLIITLLHRDCAMTLKEGKSLRQLCFLHWTKQCQYNAAVVVIWKHSGVLEVKEASRITQQHRAAWRSIRYRPCFMVIDLVFVQRVTPLSPHFADISGCCSSLS